MRLFGAIEKFEKQEDGSILIAGVASSEVVDYQGEIISADAVRKALPDWMQWGNIREQHSSNAVGKAISAEVGVDGKTRVTAKIVDSEAVKKVIAGVYKGFSIGGEILSKMGNVITRLSIVEISICDRPVNPEAVFSIWKAETKTIPVMPDFKAIAKSIGLPETATETDITTEIAKRAAPAVAPDLAALIEKAVKAAVPSVPSDLGTTILTLTKAVTDLSTRAEASDMLLQKSEREAIVAQASREGKVLPLDNDEIFGNTEKKITAVPISVLKSIAAKQTKSIPMGGRFSKAETGEVVDGEAVKFKDAAERSIICKSARSKAVLDMNEHFSRASQPTN